MSARRRYRCSTCRKTYDRRTQATACAKRLVQEKKFAIGDRVIGRESRECQSAHKSYKPIGCVMDIRGPIMVDEEYNIKWLQNAFANVHTWEYVIMWNCPHCGEHRGGSYYAPELKRLDPTTKI